MVDVVNLDFCFMLLSGRKNQFYCKIKFATFYLLFYILPEEIIILKIDSSVAFSLFSSDFISCEYKKIRVHLECGFCTQF